MSSRKIHCILALGIPMDYNTNLGGSKQFEALILQHTKDAFFVLSPKSLLPRQVVQPASQRCFIPDGRCFKKKKNLPQDFHFLNHLSLLVSWQHEILVCRNRFRNPSQLPLIKHQ
jgi:hypothetical protein